MGPREQTTYNALSAIIATMVNKDFDFRGPSEAFDLVNLDWLKDPTHTVNIPDLETSLVNIYERGDFNLMTTRLHIMPRSHMDPVFTINTYGDARERQERGENIPFAIVNHSPSFSAGDNAEVLAQHKGEIEQKVGKDQLPEVLKTVTVKYQQDGRDYIALVSGAGDFRVDKGLKRSIGAELGITNSNSKDAQLNPKDFDTTLYLGLQPGLIKPIIKPFSLTSVSGICYLKGRVEPESLVALSVSHIDTMIMRLVDFETSFREYAEDTYRGFTFLQRDNYDMYINPWTKRDSK